MLIDFPFINDELLNKYSSHDCSTAESPSLMFKYLLLKTIYSVSDLDIVERSRLISPLSIFRKWQLKKML